jgi:hypothetical protein
VSLNFEWIARAMLASIAPCFVLFVLVVRWQQARSRRSHRGRKKLRFYPTNMMMGLAFQNLQLFVAPDVRPTIEEKYEDAAEEDEDGDPASPERMLERQLRLIRNGETIDRLQVPLLGNTQMRER